MNESCPYCGMWHLGQTCLRIKAMEYYPDGTVKRVEFHPILPPELAAKEKAGAGDGNRLKRVR